MDLKTAVSTGTAIVMAIAAGVQQFRVQDLDADLGNVSTARDKALLILKETRDSAEASSKRIDASLVDLQDQLSRAGQQISSTEKENGTLRGQLEAAQANTQRVADLAEKLCKRHQP